MPAASRTCTRSRANPRYSFLQGRHRRTGRRAAGRSPSCGPPESSTWRPKPTSTARSTGRASSSAPTSSAPSSCSRPAAPTSPRCRPEERAGFPLPPGLDRRGLRLAGRRRALPRDHPLRPDLALLGLEGRGQPPGARLLPHLRPAHPGHQLLQQLRALPVSREAHPADDRQRDRRQERCRSTAPASTCATGCTSKTIARACAWSSSRVAPGEKYNLGGGNERKNIEVVARICEILEQELPPARNAALRGPRPRPATTGSRPSSPTAPATTGATPSTAPGSSKSSAGGPIYDFESGLRQTVRWYLDHHDWQEAVTRGRYERQRLGTSVAAAAVV